MTINLHGDMFFDTRQAVGGRLWLAFPLILSHDGLTGIGIGHRQRAERQHAADDPLHRLSAERKAGVEDQRRRRSEVRAESPIAIVEGAEFDGSTSRPSSRTALSRPPPLDRHLSRCLRRSCGGVRAEPLPKTTTIMPPPSLHADQSPEPVYTAGAWRRCNRLPCRSRSPAPSSTTSTPTTTSNPASRASPAST